MSEIRFYNYEFEPLCIETNIISTYKTLYYNNIGIYEARISPFSDCFLRLVDEPYILAEDEGMLFVITAKQAGDVCTLYGRTPNWFLSKRFVFPFTSKRLFEAGAISQKTAEAIVRYLVEKNFGKEEGDFLLKGTLGTDEEIDFRRIVVNSLSDVVIDCLETAGAGHRVYFDKEQKRWIFEMLTGKESDLIIGEAQKNTYSSEFVENALYYANCGIYEKSFEDMGDWDAKTNTPELSEYSAESFGKRYRVTNGGTRFGIEFSVGEYASYSREDGKIGITSAENGYPCTILEEGCPGGVKRWYGSLLARTEDTAMRELEKKKWQKTIEAESTGLVLGRDYNLGDIVRVQKKIGNGYITSKKRIVGTEFRMENGAKSEKIIFENV